MKRREYCDLNTHRLSHKYSACKRVLLNVLTEKLKVVTLLVSLECYRKYLLLVFQNVTLQYSKVSKATVNRRKLTKNLHVLLYRFFTEVVETGDQLHDVVSQCLHLDT